MNASIAPESKEREVTRIAAAIGRYGLHRPHHRGVGETMDTVSGFENIYPERGCDLLEGGARALTLDRHGSACQSMRVEVTQNNAGVRDRGLCASFVVTRGPR